MQRKDLFKAYLVIVVSFGQASFCQLSAKKIVQKPSKARA
jgi:hypothetical protein